MNNKRADNPKFNFLIQIISSNSSPRNLDLIPSLNKQGVKFKITPAVMLTEKEFKEKIYHSNLISNLLCQREINKGEIGCSLAHKNAAKELVESNLDFGIVFEDDAEIISKFDFALLENKLKSHEPTIIFLGWIPGYAVATNNKVLNKNMSQTIELLTSATCAFAYAINKPAANLLANSSPVVLDLADWPISLINRVKYFSLRTPWVSASQDPSQSTIGSRDYSDSNNLIYFQVRKIKLIFSVIIMLIIGNFLRPRISARQILHRMLIRDYIYKFGVREFKSNLDKGIVAIPESSRALRRIVKYFG